MTNQYPPEEPDFVPGPNVSGDGWPVYPEAAGSSAQPGQPAPYGQPGSYGSVSQPPAYGSQGQPPAYGPAGQAPAFGPDYGPPGPPPMPYGSQPGWSPDGAGLPPGGTGTRKSRKGLIIALVVGVVVVALATVGILWVLGSKDDPGATPSASVAPSTARSSVTPSSGTPSSATPTSTQTASGSATPSGPRADLGPGSASGTGSFAELRLPGKIGQFTADSRYPTSGGNWIGTPSGAVSVGWYYEGTLRDQDGRLVASLVQDSTVSKLNPLSFEKQTRVGDAVCGEWLMSYVACFINVHNGFVGVQIRMSEFVPTATNAEVAQLATSLASALR